MKEGPMNLLRFFLLALCMIVVGCGSVGKDFNSSKVEKIQNNVTTQLEILEWFGLPFKEGTENKHTMWTYQVDTWQAVGIGISKGLVILFDDNNIVKAYRYESN
jgi:hypothetical protein